MLPHLLKQHTLLTLLLMSQCVCAAETIGGLIGGIDSSTGYVATVSPYTGTTPISLGNNILAVALNNSGVGIVGGSKNPGILLYGAFISSTGGVQTIPFPNNPGSSLNSVAINSAGLGLVGGATNNIQGYAAFVSPTAVTPLPINPPAAIIADVALNDSNVGLVGGEDLNGDPYAAIVSPIGPTVTPLVLNASDGAIRSVAINSNNLGLIGGVQDSSNLFAAFVANNTVVPITFNGTTGEINAVALNNSAGGLVGGSNPSGAFGAFVAPGTAPLVIPSLPGNGEIKDVAVNSTFTGLIGGTDGDNMYAAFVTPSNTPLPVVGLPQGEINSVAINTYNQGLIGGNTIFGAPYAAILSSSGSITPVNIEYTQGHINSVALNCFCLSQVPTDGLQDNHLIVANYITENAPQTAYYFIPSVVDGSLESALESASPTRNMISYNTVMQNSFYLTTNLSAHLRNQRLINVRASRPNTKTAAILDLSDDVEGELLAGKRIQPTKKETAQCMTVCPPKTMGVWFDVIGVLAYQDAQQQTTAFNPQTLGGTVGFDGKVGDTFTLGGGGSYFYTHVHESNHQGFSNIQQEDLFAYASWQPRNFYVDLGIWGGLYQTKQTRHIQMTGFDFKSTSKPRGWQVVPHLELGFLATAYCTPKLEITWNLLGMADWANAWQYDYTEKGDSPFNVHQDSHYGSLLRAEGGVRFSETFFFRTWNLIFQEKGSYVNIQSFKAGTMEAFLVGSPGSFTVQTLTNAQNLGLVQLSMTAAPYKSGLPTSMLMYQGEFGSGYQSHQLNLEFNWTF